MFPLARAAVLASGLVLLVTGVPGAEASIPQGRLFSGLPYVGALFHDNAGVLGSHFCTASVVRSPQGNLLITSAHCMSGQTPSSVAFAPDYHNGNFPFGTYTITGVYTDQAWQQHQSQDDDVAILQLGSDIQQHTGALTLVTGHGPAASKVVGYPDSKTEPVECWNTAVWYIRGHQLKFVCGGYPNGTSGGPWILTKTMDVYGVIGGYQQGGAVSWISYSPYFGSNIQTLYNKAVAANP
jgi:hypothetical protein